MRIRNVLKEFEAHLKPAKPGVKINGKSEWKQYADGTYRFKISIRNIDLADGSRVDVLIDGTRAMQLTVQDNKARANLESPTQVEIPKVQASQVLRVAYENRVLAEGKYEAE